MPKSAIFLSKVKFVELFLLVFPVVFFFCQKITLGFYRFFGLFSAGSKTKSVACYDV